MESEPHASKISKVAVSSNDAETENASCSLSEDIDLLMSLNVYHENQQVRRIAGAFTLAIVGSLVGQRFNGAYFFCPILKGRELPDQSLETSPLFMGIRSMGVENPSAELLAEVAAGLETMVKRVMSNAGLEEDIKVEPSTVEWESTDELQACQSRR